MPSPACAGRLRLLIESLQELDSLRALVKKNIKLVKGVLEYEKLGKGLG